MRASRVDNYVVVVVVVTSHSIDTARCDNRNTRSACVAKRSVSSVSVMFGCRLNWLTCPISMASRMDMVGNGVAGTILSAANVL